MSDLPYGCPFCAREGKMMFFFEELDSIEHIQTVHGGRRKDDYS